MPALHGAVVAVSVAESTNVTFDACAGPTKIEAPA
jgi:hypothetical protein